MSSCSLKKVYEETQLHLARFFSERDTRNVDTIVNVAASISIRLSTDCFSIYLSGEMCVSAKKKIGKSPELECCIAGEARPTRRFNPITRAPK